MFEDPDGNLLGLLCQRQEPKAKFGEDPCSRKFRRRTTVPRAGRPLRGKTAA